VGDVTVYGSQAISLFTGKPLDSKHIDLLATLSLEDLRDLSILLWGSERFEVRRVGTALVMTTYARVGDGIIAVEIFSETPLGPVARYRDSITEVDYQGTRFWTVTPSFYVACKLGQDEALTARDVEKLNYAAEYIDVDKTLSYLLEAGKIDNARRIILDALERVER
jgi:hypothetical protein